MKIPNTFVPEKSLENKILDLTKEPKTFHNEAVYGTISQEEAEPYYILCMAEEVAKRSGNSYGAGYHQFKKNKLAIELKPDGGLKIYLKKTFFKKEKVFEFSPHHFLTPIYTRGEWKKDLEKLYGVALQR